jgi:Ca2+-binding RTX toxin-like protein
VGGAGDDEMTGATTSTCSGPGRNDIIEGNDGYDLVLGGDGDDMILGATTSTSSSVATATTRSRAMTARPSTFSTRPITSEPDLRPGPATTRATAARHRCHLRQQRQRHLNGNGNIDVMSDRTAMTSWTARWRCSVRHQQRHHPAGNVMFGGDGNDTMNAGRLDVMFGATTTT